MIDQNLNLETLLETLKAVDYTNNEEVKEHMVYLTQQIVAHKKLVKEIEKTTYTLEHYKECLTNNVHKNSEPVLEVAKYEDPNDEYKSTGTFLTSDPNDKRFGDYVFDYRKKTASLSAGYQGGNWALYSMNENHPLTVIEGKVQFKLEDYYGEGEGYLSEVIENPTFANALVHFAKAMYVTRDFHHCFLEGYAIEEVDGVKIVRFCTGS